MSLPPIVISDSEDPCDVDPDECLRGEDLRETEVDSEREKAAETHVEPVL